MRVLYIALAIMLTLSPLLSFSATATQSYGYICRLAVDTQYSSDEDIKVQVVAFYSENGRYVPRPVHVTIVILTAGTSIHIKTVNATINDNNRHKVNLGRLEQGTYTIRANFIEAGEVKTENFAVLHPPIAYSISIGPQRVKFHSLGGKNDTFTVTIKVLYSPENEITFTRSNITNLTYSVSGSPQILTIWVLDRWGNINAQNGGKAYVYTYTKPTEYYFWRPYAAFGILILGFVAIVYLKKHEVVA